MPGPHIIPKFLTALGIEEFAQDSVYKSLHAKNGQEKAQAMI